MVLVYASLFTVSHFPVLALLIVGAFCVLAILMLVAIIQQEKYVFSIIPLCALNKTYNKNT